MTVSVEKYVIMLTMFLMVSFAIIALAALKMIKRRRMRKELKARLEYLDSTDLIRDEGFCKTVMLSFPSKEVFMMLKKLCEDHGYMLFAKVKLDHIVSANSTLKDFRLLQDLANIYCADYVVCNEDFLPIMVIDKRHTVINIARSAGYETVQAEKMDEKTMKEIVEKINQLYSRISCR